MRRMLVGMVLMLRFMGMMLVSVVVLMGMVIVMRVGMFVFMVVGMFVPTITVRMRMFM